MTTREFIIAIFGGKVPTSIYLDGVPGSELTLIYSSNIKRNNGVGHNQVLAGASIDGTRFRLADKDCYVRLEVDLSDPTSIQQITEKLYECVENQHEWVSCTATTIS